MNIVKTPTLSPENLRETLQAFWSEMLTIKTSRNGVVLTLPMNYPDGMQVVLWIEPMAGNQARLTDHGKTLGNLFLSGLNFDSRNSRTHALLEEQRQAFELERKGTELFRVIPLPPQGIDVQLFGEALVSIAHLVYRHDPGTGNVNPAQKSLEKVFAKRDLQPKRNHKLTGATRPVTVDYFLEGTKPVAVQLIGRRGNIHGYMEQWGWRWLDLQKKTPDLQPAMIYDSDRQQVDQASRDIAKKVCKVFCPYQEIELLDKLLVECGTLTIKI